MIGVPLKDLKLNASADLHPTALTLTRRQLASAASALAMSAASTKVWAAIDQDPLKQCFLHPPGAVRPRVWWHWMNGNISKDGIRRDIAWMSRVGLGGLQNFDAALDTPQIVDERLVYMSPEWKDALRYAAELSEDAGLEMAIAAAPGWSETGGPWVEPADAMKKLVWSEAVARDGRPLLTPLPPPPDVSGPYQTLERSSRSAESAPDPRYYRDVAVLAYPLTDPDAPAPSRAAVNEIAVNAARLVDGDYHSGVDAPQGTASRPTRITLAFDRAFTARSAEVYTPGDMRGLVIPNIAWLEAEGADGQWRKLVDVPLAGVPTTVGFEPVTARAFRLVLSPHPNPSPFAPPVPPPNFSIRQFRMSAERKVHRFETKAAFQVSPDYDELDQGLDPDEAGTPIDAILDLTTRLRPDGRLDWTPPSGRWRIVRLGYTLTGATNHPATAEATGLEVDKFDRDAVRRYIETYLAMYADALDPDLFGARGVRALLNDSTETGPANWTPALVEAFEQRRGYSPRPWLLTLTGVLVGSRRASDAFLFDFRQTLAELHVDHHYAQIAQAARDQGLTLYGEAHEGLYGILGDDMEMRRHADIPMGAMWTYASRGRPLLTHVMDCKGAASVANLYGKRAVAAESLTGGGPAFSDTPATLKPVIDLEFALGVNLPVIHTAVHQPLEGAGPGLTLGGIGQFFGRHETWAELARPWIDYMARSAYLLQQGRNVADVAYFYGEGSPIIARFGETPPAGAPRRHAFDFVSAEALRVLTVKDGVLVSPGGARYRLLFLGGGSRRITVPALRTIAALVQNGAVVVGKRPEATPSLGDDKAEFERLCALLWDAPSGRVGRGRMIIADEADEGLEALQLPPDVHILSPTETEVLYQHRALPDVDIFYLTHRAARPARLEAAFRVSGLKPELWRADTGAVEAVSYRIDGDLTLVSLDMEPHDAVFIVFRGAAAPGGLLLPRTRWIEAGAVRGPWVVAFQPGRGAPPGVELPALRSLTDHADPGVRYFSGVATYRTAFAAPRVRPDACVVLDLGEVADVAEVRVNGRTVGHAWKPPYRVDIGAALKPGINRLEVRVANTWVNRLIGDAQPGAAKVAYTTFDAYPADAPLRPAGLLGPVRILTRGFS